MRLKKIELSGFKSFAKRTILEFPSAVSAIVGPNGSGKSNIIEGIRWALGEQSLKSLRGKRSEDFIFNGSPSASRLGKASVAMFFDPGKDSSFGYDEVRICRRVFRDGLNEYLINDSQVRLKDIIDLLSKFGLGTSSHHIISQGESDPILNASPKERKEILEDALGLKIFQLKRQGADKKLKKTEENIRQVGSLRKEIQPHLKFLKKQADKTEKALLLKEKLQNFCRSYFSKEENFLKKEFSRIAEEKNKPLGELEKAEKKIKNIKIELQEKEKSESSSFEGIEKKIEEARLKRFSFERDLGRCEGMIDFQESRSKEAAKEAIERSSVERFIEKISQHLDEEFSEKDFEKIKNILNKIKEAIGSFSAEIKLRKQASISSDLGNLKKKKEETVSLLERARKEETDFSGRLTALKSEEEKKARLSRDLERELHDAEMLASDIKSQMRSFEIEEEKMRLRKEEFETDKKDCLRFTGMIECTGEESEFLAGEREEARREMVRLKIKLEDSEGIGEDVLKEYQHVKARDEFFEKELGDLEKAAKSLVDLMKELGQKIDNDFKKGVAEINREFQNFFTLMFGGGTAEIKIIAGKKRRTESSEIPESPEASFLLARNFGAEPEEQAEEGIDISVSLPRKRIHSLDMLSGGERSLTSIALLFAMTQVKPPPFLILDETDAALDEANSQKYAKMLKDLSNRTQLLLVTHNRETMKQASILYGVTMGSVGISQVLSVKLEKAEELAAQTK